MNKVTEILSSHVLDELRDWNCFAEFVDFLVGPFVSEDFVRIVCITACDSDEMLYEIDKNSHLRNIPDTNANPNVTNLYVRFRLNGTLCDVVQSLAYYLLITCNNY